MKVASPLILHCIKAPFLNFALTRTVTVLGRAQSCDLVVYDLSISRRHAEIRLGESNIRITDLGSRNGTFVGDVQIQTCRVIPDQIIRFGDFPFALHLSKSSSEEETADPTIGGEGGGEWQIQREKNLSIAQRRVYLLLLQGLPEKVIAARLNLSTHTIHNHTRAIFHAFGVHSRAQLLAFPSIAPAS